MDERWRSLFGAEAQATSLSSAFAAWVLCVEYVHDLARSPHLELLQPLKALLDRY